MKFASIIGKYFHTAVFGIKKKAPEILIGTSIASGIGAGIFIFKGTLKLPGITEQYNKAVLAMDTAMQNKEFAEKYSDQVVSDRKMAKKAYAIELAKAYWPAAVLSILSVTSLLVGVGILKKRNAALAAALTATERCFNEYKKRVVDKVGVEEEKKIRYGTEEVETVDENGNVTTRSGGRTFCSPYARYFDEASPLWTRDADHNLTVLRAQQEYCNQRLQKRGYLLLNEVYDILGLPKTKAGMVVGWMYGRNSGDDYVDFGIYNMHNEGSRDFVNGFEKVILLDFNVDGCIYEMMDEEGYL